MQIVEEDSQLTYQFFTESQREKAFREEADLERRYPLRPRKIVGNLIAILEGRWGAGLHLHPKTPGHIEIEAESLTTVDLFSVISVAGMEHLAPSKYVKGDLYTYPDGTQETIAYVMPGFTKIMIWTRAE